MFSQKGLQRHPVNKWNERDVCRWLRQKGLGKLWRNFHDNKVDGKVLLQITSQYLVKAADKTPVMAAHAARGTLTGKPTTVTAVPRLEAERTLDKPPIEIAE
ncbi:hypothetical protein ACROYT_G034847 [Oculina patagonica]